MESTSFLDEFYSFFLLIMKSMSLNSSTPLYALTVDELFSEFNRDAKSATLKYNDHLMLVTGKVVSISKKNYSFRVILKTSDEMLSSVKCTFGSSNNEIKKNDIITVKGKCQGYLSNVSLNKCVIVN